jgi:hypothetical protein
MKDLRIDRDITGASDIYVARGYAAKSYRYFIGSAASPVKGDSLQSGGEYYAILQ